MKVECDKCGFIWEEKNIDINLVCCPECESIFVYDTEEDLIIACNNLFNEITKTLRIDKLVGWLSKKIKGE